MKGRNASPLLLLDESMIEELREVWKIYGDGTKVYALRGVDLEIEEGEMIAIFGPSGSGKSTLLHILGLLDVATKGKVIFKGRDVSTLSEEELAEIRGKEIGFVFQAFNLIPTMTALENVELPMMIFERDEEERRKRAKELLERLGLGERLNHKPSQLSGGQKQRVAIARALAMEPSLLLADEPTGNLDSKSGEEVMKAFQELHEEGKTVVIVTHDAEIAKRAERIIYIKDGKIVKEVRK